MDPCKNGGTCLDVGDKYACVCLEGFKGNKCEVNTSKQVKSEVVTKNTDSISKPLCSQNLCQNGATCYENENIYYCICTNGFEGKNCEIRKFMLKDIFCFYWKENSDNFKMTFGIQYMFNTIKLVPCLKKLYLQRLIIL